MQDTFAYLNTAPPRNAPFIRSEAQPPPMRRFSADYLRRTRDGMWADGRAALEPLRLSECDREIGRASCRERVCLYV